MKHKIFTLLLALMASVGTIFATGGTCGDNLKWDLKDGVLTIRGEGAMTDWDLYTSIPWYSYRSSIQHVIIEDGVTNIEGGAFYCCNNLIDIDIPSSVTYIGHKAFYGCNSLTSIEIPQSVTSIGEGVFWACIALASATISDNVTSIEGLTFYQCYSLTSINIPNSVTSIEYGAFSGCSGLTSVTIPNSVTSIGDNAFYGCKSLTSVTIPNSVTTIGSDAFSGCSGLTSVTMPNSIISIGEHAFYDCYNLKSMTIPNNVTSIGEDAFYMIPNIIYHGTATGGLSYWRARILNGYVDGNLVYSEASKLTLMACFASAEGNVVIPASVEELSAYVFYKCNRITSITCESVVPPLYYPQDANLDKFSCTLYVPFESIEAYKAAEGWKEFTNILPIPETPVPCITASGTCGAQGDNLTWELTCDGMLTISGTGNMADYDSENSVPWYSSRKSITSIVINNGVTSIGNKAFYNCSSLTSVTIPNSVTSIGNKAFNNCSSLTSVTIPNSVTSIGECAFISCHNLADLTIGKNVQSIGRDVFYKVGSLNVHWNAIACTETPNTGVFAYMGSGLENIEFGDGVQIIPDMFMLKAGEKITEIIIPESVVEIGENAFASCTNKLISISNYSEIPQTIDTHTFENTDKGACVLYVPYKSIESYRNAEGWKEFTNIQPISGTEPEITEISVEICSGEQYAWCGEIYTESGSNTHTFIATNGSDSIVTLHLTVLPELKGDTTAYYCHGGSFECHGKAYTVADMPIEYTCHSKVYPYCDSIVTLHLIELPELTGDTTATITKGSSFNWHGENYTAANTPATYTYVSKVAPYCDSIVTLNLIEIEEPTCPFTGICGYQGANLTWELSCDSVLTISGTGGMADYTGENEPWHKYKNKIAHVVINEGITRIGVAAFFEHENLSSISIPNSVTSIGGEAFHNCNKLKAIDIPQNITIIDDATFISCSNLTSITIPKGVSALGDWTFAGCTGLTSIYDYATTPQTVGGLCWLDVDKSIPLYVPFESIEAYRAAEEWKEFTNIQPILYNEHNDTIVFCYDDGSKVEYQWPGHPSFWANVKGGKKTYYRDRLLTVTRPKAEATADTRIIYELSDTVSHEIYNQTLIFMPPYNSGRSERHDAISTKEWFEWANVIWAGEKANTAAIPNPRNLDIITLHKGTYSQGDWTIQYLASDFRYIMTKNEQTKPYHREDGTWTVTCDSTILMTVQVADVYTISFVNYDGTELQSGEVEYGDTPVYTGDTPAKPADAQYTYSFSGWTPEVVAVTSEATYTAVFEPEVRKYAVTWQDEDGNPIKVDEVAYGETPVFRGTTPTKDATAEYTYEFAGWLPKVKEVTEDVKYTTFFERNKIEPTVYTVNINGENCSLHISNELPAGTTLQVEAVADECFEFQKWSDNNTDNPRTITVTEDASLTAEFNKVTYTITGENENEGGEVQIIP